MEFHADALAAAAQGGPQLVNALYKVEYSGLAWDGAMNELGAWLTKGHKARDVFAIHTAHVRFLRDMPDDLPADRVFDDIRRERVVERPRLLVHDQWASHPSLIDREANVAGVGLEVAPDERPAWTLFRNADRLRERMSAMLYEQAPGADKATEPLSPQGHVAALRERSERFKFDDRFHGVFDGRVPEVLPSSTVEAMDHGAVPDLGTFFTPEVARRHAAITRLRAEHELLCSIRDGQVDADSFELDGVKHSRKEAASCAERLAGELAVDEQWARENDRQAQVACSRAARAAGQAGPYAQVVDRYVQVAAMHERTVKVLEQGRKVHVMASAKPRFDEQEWKALGLEASAMYNLLQRFLTDQAPSGILDPEVDRDQVRAMERVQRSGVGSSTFEPDLFWGTYESVVLLEERAREKRVLAFKDITQVQLAWMPPG
jgi:hypothetical protein